MASGSLFFTDMGSLKVWTQLRIHTHFFKSKELYVLTDKYYCDILKMYFDFQWHPNYVERPHTNNPVTPLLDSVYDLVIKRYPKK